MDWMTRQGLQLYGILVLAFVVGLVVGGLMGWSLHRTPTLAAIELGLVIVAGVLVWLRWGRSQ